MVMDNLMFVIILGGMALSGVAFVAEYRSRRNARVAATQARRNLREMFANRAD